MKEHGLTDEQVEREIKRLSASKAVALAKKKARLDYRRRQYLYTLRFLEKRGKELMDAGITEEILESMYNACDVE